MHLPEITVTNEMLITLAQVRAQAVVDFPDDDPLLDSYLKAAIAKFDGPNGVLRRAVRPQSVVQRFDRFQRFLRLPYGPVNEITSIEYQDETGTTQTLSGWYLHHDFMGAYLQLAGGSALPKVVEKLGSIQVNYGAGYATSGVVPDDLLRALSEIVASWYASRESYTLEQASNLVPFSAVETIHQYRAELV